MTPRLSHWLINDTTEKKTRFKNVYFFSMNFCTVLKIRIFSFKDLELSPYSNICIVIEGRN